MQECSPTISYDIIMALVTGIVSGIISSLLATRITKQHDKQRAKAILLNNFRFMESIEESHMFARSFLTAAEKIIKYYGGVEWFHFPGKINSEVKTSVLNNAQCQKDILSFYEHKKSEINNFIGLIKFEKNDILYDSIDKSLGIYYNRELNDIRSNLKSRAHNFIDKQSMSSAGEIMKGGIIAMYYAAFDILAYISYLFDLYAFLGIEDKLNINYDMSLQIVKAKYPRKR